MVSQMTKAFAAYFCFFSNRQPQHKQSSFKKKNRNTSNKTKFIVTAILRCSKMLQHISIYIIYSLLVLFIFVCTVLFRWCHWFNIYESIKHMKRKNIERALNFSAAHIEHPFRTERFTQCTGIIVHSENINTAPRPFSVCKYLLELLLFVIRVNIL